MIELLDELYNTMEGLNEGFVFNTNNELLRTDIYETKDNYVLEIEVPGYKKENVSLNVENGILDVVIKTERSDKKRHFLRKERGFKYYLERTYDIGNQYTNEDITASMENGLLTVLLPKEVKKIENKKYIEIK